MIGIRSSRGASLAALLWTVCLPAGPAVAQRDAVELPPDRFAVKQAEPALVRGAPVVARTGAPPVLDLPAKGPLPQVPVGTGGNPEPRTPPGRLVDPGAGQPEAGAFVYWKNTVVQAQGASRSTSSEVAPCSIAVRDTVLQTGNWYAALSRDMGQSWTHVDPYTFFPSVDGGFCCNQRVEYVRSHDLAVWVLQYLYSGTTHKGSLVIAVANGRDELRSGDPADWTRYEFDPTDFGFPQNTWLDLSDVGFNDDWLYLAANVHDGPTAAFMGAVVWRVSLYDLQQNRSVTHGYLTDATMGGDSYRFATRAGDGTNMYWASLLSTTSIRIWRQNTIAINRDYVDRSTAIWRSTSNACPGPDGRGWMGNAIGRIRGACGTATELTFAWASDGNGTTRPYPYTRIAVYRVSDRSLLSEHDVYSTTDCWAYAALDSSSLGHIGGVIAIGGPTRYVRTSAFLVDGYGTWASGIVAYRMGDPTNNPPSERFGPYFDVQRNPLDERTFVGAGSLMNGGDQNRHVEPHHVWFGRDDYPQPTVALDVRSAPIANVPIRLDVTDNSGQKDGSTPFQRTFYARQGYELTAPATVIAGNTTFLFDHWLVDGAQRHVGQRVLTVAILSGNSVAEARYRARRTLTIDASAHTPAVGVMVSPTDLNGQSSGITPFAREYTEGTQVTLTLPAGSVGPHPFRGWRIDGQSMPAGQLSVTFTVGAADSRATAVFFERTPGSLTAFGTGCDGQNGTDRHFASGTPETGETIDLRLSGGPPLTTAWLVIGASNALWQGVPLPYVLPGAAPCSVYASVDVPFTVPTDATGAATFPLAIPADPALIGAKLYTQYVAFDPGANAIDLTLSNGLRTVVGGVR